MAGNNSTVSPDSYRVDVVPSEHGSVFNVMRCEHVAHFDSEEHATFLVELLTRGQHD